MTPLTHIEAIQLLEQLIATPSPSREEDATATLLAEFLQKQGITPHRHHNNVWAYTKNYNPQKPTLLLNSHHDTVKPWVNEDVDNTTEDPVFSPFEPIRKDGKLYGLGSNDAGASLVCLITTFCNYYTTPRPFNLVLLLSAEEEVSGPKGLRSILPVWKERNINIDMAIVGEPTEMQAAIGERGLVVIDAYAKGVRGHAARNEGENAIYKAITDIQTLQNFQFNKQSSLLGPISINVTQIQAGQQHNVVPDLCHFVIDIRTTDAYTNEEVLAMLQAKLTSQLTPRSTHIRASAISQTHPLVVAAQQMHTKLFVSPTTSDMALMPFPSIKLGAGKSARSHSKNEYIEITEIQHAINYYNQYIQTLASLL